MGGWGWKSNHQMQLNMSKMPSSVTCNRCSQRFVSWIRNSKINLILNNNHVLSCLNNNHVLSYLNINYLLFSHKTTWNNKRQRWQQHHHQQQTQMTFNVQPSIDNIRQDCSCNIFFLGNFYGHKVYHF